jgi:hypothetical protein
VGDNINQLGELLSMFAEREGVYTEYTQTIAEHLYPTVLSALLELFDVTNEQVDWDELYVTESDVSLHVKCSIHYGPDDIIPQCIVDITLDSLEVVADRVRSVHIGLPLVNVFRSKAELLDFFQRLLKSTILDNPKTDSKANQLDLSGLTEEQTTQLLIFQQLNYGAKH